MAKILPKGCWERIIPIGAILIGLAIFLLRSSTTFASEEIGLNELIRGNSSAYLQSTRVMIALAPGNNSLGTLETASIESIKITGAAKVDEFSSTQEGSSDPIILFSESQANQDLAIRKSHNGDFLIGTTVTYTIDVSNVGGDTVSDPITVTDNIPTSLTPLQIRGMGWDPCDYAAGVVTCVYSNTVGVESNQDLPPIFLSVTVGEAAAPVVTNTVVVTNVNDTQNTENNTFSAPATVESADLEVVKKVIPATPREGDIITYTVTITNNGPSDATGVVLTDTLPSGLIYLWHAASPGIYISTTGAWDVGAISNQTKATLSLIALVDYGTRGLRITNTTNGLKSDLYDYDSENNVSSARFTVQTTGLTGLVTEYGTGTPIITATLVVTDIAQHVYTTTTDATGWYTFTGTITNPLAAGVATVSVSKAGYNPASETKTLTANVITRQDFELNTSDLNVFKSDDRTTVVPGDTITYTITITNIGSYTATHVVITDVLSTHLSYITDTLEITHTIPVTGTYVWTLPDELTPDELISFTVRARVATALPSSKTPVSNLAIASTASPEADLSNNEWQDTDTSTGTPNLSITNSVSPSQISVGNSTTYQIKVANSGSAPATDVTVTDSFSSYLNITSATTDKGTATTNSSTRTVTVSIEVLDPGETVTIKIVTKANTSVTSNKTVSNTAALKYTFGGSVTTKNSNSVILKILARSTLPGTGGRPAEREAPGGFWPALLSGLLLGLLGIFAFSYSLWAKGHRPDWASWYARIGLLLVSTALVFGLIALGLKSYSTQEEQYTLLFGIKPPQISKQSPEVQTAVIEITNQPYPTPELIETLPDYPIPTPSIITPPKENEAQLDVSPVNRIILPALGVDTVVKYVPFEGLTWLIGGLQQEVAWMGDTSWPGLGGNIGLAGHITLPNGVDGPFRHLANLVTGDEISVYTEQNIYTYRTREQRVVGDTDFSVLESTNDAQLTLITCTDWDSEIGFYLKRLVVFADLVDVEPLLPAAGETDDKLPVTALK